MLRPGLFLLLSATFLYGCSGQYATGKPENLLDGEGEYELVEVVDEDATPENKHMATRGKVNPAQVSGSRKYTQNVKKSPANEETHFRVLKLERKFEDVREDFKGLKDVIQVAENRKVLQDTAPPKTAISGSGGSAPSKIAPSAGGPTDVRRVRTGEHPGKTRLVLDLTGPAQFKYEIDNEQNLLLIELPDANWDADQQKVFGRSKMLQAYAMKTAQNGSALMAVKLNGPAKLTMKTALPPNKVHGHRLVFDVAPL